MKRLSDFAVFYYESCPVLAWETERDTHVFCSFNIIPRSVPLTNHKTRTYFVTHIQYLSSCFSIIETWAPLKVFALKERISVLTSLITQSQEPSFHPSFHLSSTREQSNSGFPSRTLMSLWIWQNHWERVWRLLVSGWLVFNLRRGNSALRKGLLLSNDIFHIESKGKMWSDLSLRSSAHSSQGKNLEKRLMNCPISCCWVGDGRSG